MARSKWVPSPKLVAAVFLLAAFAWFVWPTPWRYARLGQQPVRTHRVTSRAELLTTAGWEVLERPAVREVAPVGARRRSMRGGWIPDP